MSRQRHNAKNESSDKKPDTVKPSYQEPQPGPWGVAREWVDTLVFAYLLAMFIRTFAVELYKIPTGSMTPALVGDQIFEGDLDGDEHDDLVVSWSNGYQVFYHNGDYEERRRLPRGFESTAKPQGFRYDRIIVNKLAYLFAPPKRGDIAVFKVPKEEWLEEKPIYVKRVTALGGELVDVTFEGSNRQNGGRLTIDGQLVEEPEIFQRLSYTDNGRRSHPFLGKTVPADHVMMFGDNTWNSSDGRVWGAVPAINFKGKAFLRYWPIAYKKGNSRLSYMLGAGKLSNFGLLEQSQPKLRWALLGAYFIFLFLAVKLYIRIDQHWRGAIHPA